MAGPLAGIEVVEIGQEIQGPYAALYLADMGAAVVKIENRETGDLSRWLRADTFFPGVRAGHVSPYFLAMNRQAQHHARPQEGRGERDPAAAASTRRGASHELPPGGPRSARLFVRGALDPTPTPRLRPGLVVGTDGSVEAPPQPRHARAGGGRPDGEDGASGES